MYLRLQDTKTTKAASCPPLPSRGRNLCPGAVALEEHSFLLTPSLPGWGRASSPRIKTLPWASRCHLSYSSAISQHCPIPWGTLGWSRPHETISKGGPSTPWWSQAPSHTLLQRNMIWAVYGVWALLCGWQAAEPSTGRKVLNVGLFSSYSCHIKRPNSLQTLP